MSKKIKAKVRIGRYMNNDQKFTLTIEDRTSGIEFVDFEFDSNAFADLLSNRFADIDGVVRGLDNVGKKYERKPYDVVIPEHINTYNKDQLREYLDTEIKPEFEKRTAWYLDTYINSQTSVSHETDTMSGKRFYVAHLSMYRYVEVEDEA